jgi:hypothetical protein
VKAGFPIPDVRPSLTSSHRVGRSIHKGQIASRFLAHAIVTPKRNEKEKLKPAGVRPFDRSHVGYLLMIF